MGEAHGILGALAPITLFRALGVVAGIGLSPIVGYLALGLALGGFRVDIIADDRTDATLAELGVVFLLFDIGLHFSLAHVPRIWEPVALHGRRIIALTAPDFEVSRELAPAVQAQFPDIKRMAAVRDADDVESWRAIGVIAAVDRSVQRGMDFPAGALGTRRRRGCGRPADARAAGPRTCACRQGCRGLRARA